ncbi:MAG TPA: glycoside hydrolase family 97 N-terminal domain-containing protein, partial [Puia sp.]|nr:glycoside hydrolase family 97 N-terminal domain-containing protein [Puia sp.]
MKYSIQRCCIACFFIPLFLPAQKNVQLTSPDGRIVFSFFVKNRSAFYSVMFKNKPLINDSPLTLEF